MATNKNFIVKNGLDVSGTANLSTLNLSGSLTGPATFTIDPAAIGDNTGTVVIAGNLQVDGTQTTINSTTMTVDDLNLTLASGAANAAAANGAGLTVDGSSATLLYANGDDSWAVNKRFKAQSDIRLGSDGVRLSTDGNGEFGVGYGQTATNNRFTVYNNTTAALRVLPNGNVGINESSPSHRLHINGGSNDEARVRVTNTASGQASLDLDNSEGYFRTYTDAGEYRIYDQTDGTHRLVIDTSGNVGIGTDTPGDSLVVKGDGARITVESEDMEVAMIGRRGSSGSALDSGYIRLRNQGVTANGIVLDSDNVSWINGGNLGIGTTVPAYKLALESTTTGLTHNLKLNKSSTTGDYAEIAFQLWDGAGTGLNTFGGSGTSRPSVVLRAVNEATNSAAGAFVVGTFTGGASNSTLTEKFRIASDGKVGIGTSVPASILTVDSGTATGAVYSPTNFNSASQIKIDVASAQNNYAGIQFTHSGNTEGFIGLIRPSATAADSDFVIQGYSSNKTAYTEYLRITDEGYVGIGTTDPSALLHLKSTANSAGPSLIFENTNNAQNMNIDYWNNAGAVQSRIQYAEGPASFNFIPNVSNNNSALYIAYDGKVGIGTTNPGENLHVEGSMMLDAYNVGAEEGLFFREGFSSSNKYNLGIMTYAHNGSSIDGMTIGAYNGFSVCTGSNTRNERLRISNTGQFFINSNDGGSGKVTAANTWAGAKFIVRETNGFIDMQSSGDSQTVGYRLGYREHTELAGYIKYSTGAAQMFIDNNYTGSSSQDEYSTMYFRNKNSSNQLKKRMRIGGANGYISTNPIGDAVQTSHQFEVQGGTAGTIFLSNNLAGYTVGQYPVVGTSGNDLHFQAANTYTGYISYNGGFTDVSDEREKENITTITNATSKLKQLRGVTHTWKDNRDNGTIHLGLIAQEVQTVVPEVVSEGPTKPDESEPILGVHYGKLVPLLIETIKELEARITALEG